MRTPARTCDSQQQFDENIDFQAGDPEIRDPLALFTAVLIARSCLSLEDVVKHVAIPSLLPSFSHLGPNEAGELKDR